MDEFHTTLAAGHLGSLKTYQRVAHSFYWHSMKADIEQFVAECDVC